jgi:hypothetical protein
MRSLTKPSLTDRAVLQERIAHLVRRRCNAECGDAVYAALYFLCWQTAMHGRRCAARKYKHDPRPDLVAWWNELQEMDDGEARGRLLHYLQRYGFLGVIANVPAALCAWLRKSWPLTLCEHIPSSEEVLDMQVRGTRPVTILSHYPRLLLPVLNKANAYAFMVHDLEHAYKYFYDPDLYRGQRRFFTAIERVLRLGILDDCLRDMLFADKFAYLISDMNTHVAHSLQFLRAILIEHHLRREHKPPRAMLSVASREQIEAVMQPLFAALRMDTVLGEAGLLRNSSAVRPGLDMMMVAPHAAP